MEYIGKFILGTSLSNWRIQNKVNIFNLLYDILYISDELQRANIIMLIKKNIGITIYDEFKIYVMKKGLDGKVLISLS